MKNAPWLVQMRWLPKMFPPFTVVGGVPARVIRDIDECSLQEKSIDEYEIIGINTYTRL